MDSTALVLGASAGIVAIVIACIVLQLVTEWKIFEKYGEPGWKGLIPFYGQYIEYTKVWNNTMAMVALILSIVSLVAGFTSIPYLGTIITLATFVINIMFQNKKAKAFGKGIGMTLVLIFFTFIGNLILGLGDAEYQGPQD